MFQPVEQWLTSIHSSVFEHLVQPLLFACGGMAYAEAAFTAVYAGLLGAGEIILMYAIMRPLEVVRPVETWLHRRGVRVDVLYTWRHRLGVLPLLVFALLTPLKDRLDTWLHGYGFIPSILEDLLPGLPRNGLLTFLLYLIIHDAVAYGIHRAQHRYAWWWALHSLHHSQRQLSFWSDDRNHVLDDVLRASILALVARLIGVPPGQFVTLTLLTQGLESLAHINARSSFGFYGERLLVGPRFHRLHHAIGAGHEGATRGCNFAVLLPLWDMLCHTANFQHVSLPTGIRDQLAGRDYGRGFWQQQWLGLQRLYSACTQVRFLSLKE